MCVRGERDIRVAVDAAPAAFWPPAPRPHEQSTAWGAWSTVESRGRETQAEPRIRAGFVTGRV
eukprot:2293950-Prymnesium_polylepis.1